MNRRAGDKGWLCWVAARASQGWDWIDKRDIDKHLLTLAILYGTVRVTVWAMRYAEMLPGQPGLEKAAIIGAVVAPYMALQAAAIKWYFDARSS